MKYEIVKLNTARNCLRYIIRAFNITELYLPYYLCPAIRNSAVKENCKLKFYHIKENFMPVEKFPADAYILYPDYFGICAENIENLEKLYKNLIIDNAHAFFSEPKGIACFNSIRKFFPSVRNGAFLYTKKLLHTKLEKDFYFYEQKELSFEEICKNENLLDNEDIKLISDCSLKYFLQSDLNLTKQLFCKNFSDYAEKFQCKNKLKISLNSNAVPFKYPYLAETEEAADEIVRFAVKKNKIIYRYWHNLPKSFKERIFYTKLVAL